MSKARQKGTSFETLIVNYLRQLFPLAERRALKGVNDEGDINLGDPRFTFECKNVAKLNFSGWINEVEVERQNAGAEYGILIAKRRGYGQPEDQYAVMTVATLHKLLSQLK